MKPHPHRDLVLINAAGFLRSLGVGLIGVVVGIYLFRVGLSSFAIGLIIAAGLVGSALATIIVSFAADRLGRRRVSYISLASIWCQRSCLGPVARARCAFDDGVHRHAEWHRHGSLRFLCPRPSHCSGTGS